MYVYTVYGFFICTVCKYIVCICIPIAIYVYIDTYVYSSQLLQNIQTLNIKIRTKDNDYIRLRT